MPLHVARAQLRALRLEPLLPGHRRQHDARGRDLTGEPARARKRALRRTLRSALRRIGDDQRRAAAAGLQRRVLALPDLATTEADSRGALVCLSFGLEIDTWPLVDTLAARGIEVFVPRVRLADRTFHVHPYLGQDELETLSMGLRQPREGSPELTHAQVMERVGLALVLGLGFDPRGVRLGYGGGYFDRFLGATGIPGVGLAFDEQVLDRLPREPHDVPMVNVVTPTRVLGR